MHNAPVDVAWALLAAIAVTTWSNGELSSNPPSAK
jgi:hypothetical protein